MASKKNATAKVLSIYQNGTEDGNIDNKNLTSAQLEAAYLHGCSAGSEETKNLLLKIISSEAEGGLGMSNLYDIFGTDNYNEILADYSIADIRMLIKTFEDNRCNKPNIDLEIGDEIEFIYFGHMHKGVISKLAKEDNYLYTSVLCSDGSAICYRYDLSKPASVYRTGRKFNQIKTLLQSLNNKENI